MLYSSQLWIKRGKWFIRTSEAAGLLGRTAPDVRSKFLTHNATRYRGRRKGVKD